MMTLRKTFRLGGFAGVLGMAMASPSLAEVMYTVKDVGASSNSQVGLFNLTGNRMLRVDDAGNISDDPFRGAPNPLPNGMRPLGIANANISPNGNYSVGTAFANASPSAPWGGYVLQGFEPIAIGTLDPNSPTAYSTALAVNNSGTVVGSSGETNGPAGSHAIMVDVGGKMTDLGSFGGSLSSALGINSTGTIVGESQDGGASFGVFRAFVSDGRGLTDLNALIAPIPGFQLVSATGINDVGQIAAYGRFAIDPESLYHEILLSPLSLASPSLLPTADPSPIILTTPIPQPSPVPEPNTVALFGLIAGAVGLKAWRQRSQR